VTSKDILRGNGGPTAPYLGTHGWTTAARRATDHTHPLGQRRRQPRAPPAISAAVRRHVNGESSSSHHAPQGRAETFGPCARLLRARRHDGGQPEPGVLNHGPRDLTRAHVGPVDARNEPEEFPDALGLQRLPPRRRCHPGLRFPQRGQLPVLGHVRLPRVGITSGPHDAEFQSRLRRAVVRRAGTRTGMAGYGSPPAGLRPTVGAAVVTGKAPAGTAVVDTPRLGVATAASGFTAFEAASVSSSAELIVAAIAPHAGTEALDLPPLDVPAAGVATAAAAVGPAPCACGMAATDGTVGGVATPGMAVVGVPAAGRPFRVEGAAGATLLGVAAVGGTTAGVSGGVTGALATGSIASGGPKTGATTHGVALAGLSLFPLGKEIPDGSGSPGRAVRP